MAKKIFESADGHVVHIHSHEKLSDGEIVINLRCCNDPTTQTRHLFSHAEVINGKVVHGLEKDTLLSKLQKNCAPTTAQKHAAMIAADQFLKEMMDEGQISTPTHTPTMKLHD